MAYRDIQNHYAMVNFMSDTYLSISYFPFECFKAVSCFSGFKKWIQVFIPKLSELIRTDEERSVVMACLEAYAEVLKEVGAPVLVPQGHLEAIINCVKDVMQKKVFSFQMYYN